METKTLHIRLKGNTKPLEKMARDVNLVWNYCNELSAKAYKQRHIWLSAYDLHAYTSGSTEFLNIGSATIQAIQEEYATRRKQFKKLKLRWRTKKSLGWVPFKTSQIKFKNGVIRFNKKSFKVWDSYGLENYELRTGNFSQDTLGNWYLNVTVKFEPTKSEGTESIGVDLGLKELATLSDGSSIESNQFYRNLETKLAVAQRANKKHQIKNIHRKIKNKRKDFLHKESTELVKRSKKIAVGNVSSSKLAKTKMAKSVLDAGWGMFKTMLEYKSRWASVEFKVVNEAYSTQTCSQCGTLSGPKGLKGLGIRYWVCEDCGAEHQRDVNAARNILNTGFGHEPLVGGISVL